ncbi:hypothetical protein ACFYN3_40710 [Streptomyces lavendulae]|uniref:hypothetical protein n=1 Tax=Streptomyces lavendulae TaxID=1914 RepID=UPI00369DB670
MPETPGQIHPEHANTQDSHRRPARSRGGVHTETGQEADHTPHQDQPQPTPTRHHVATYTAMRI